MDRFWKTKLCTFVVLLVALMPARAVASTKTWSATPSSGTWSDPSNWAGNVAPLAGDSLVFPASSTIKSTTNDLGAAFAVSSLTFDGNGYTLSGNSITLDASGISCTTPVPPQTDTIAMDVVLGATITMNFVSGCDFTITGVISGPFGINMGPGSGVLELSGANTFTGVLAVSKGLLVAENALALGFADGTPATGTTIASGAGLDIFTSSTIANEALSLAGNGSAGSNTGSLYSATPTIWAGPIALTADAQVGTPAGLLTLSGVISGAGGLTKLNAGQLVLSGSNTYTGATVVSAGELVVNGTLSSTSSTTVKTGATLGGTGTISNATTVEAGGTISPGAGSGSGILNTGSVSFSAGSTFSADINGPSAGTDYDRLSVVGTVDLTGSTLNVNLRYPAIPGTTFVVINNDSLDAVSGTFAGLAEGASFIVKPYTFTISYVGGTGNDVVLTVTAAPTELLTNGAFSNGMTNWQTFATPDLSYILAAVTNGVMEFSRVPPPPGTSNQATVFQETGAPIVLLGTLQAQFDLANTSSVRKYLKVLLVDSDFSDIAACTFWLPANASVKTYQMRTHTTKSWTNAAIYFYAGNANGPSDTGSYQVDNVSLQFAPTLPMDHTDCVDPLVPSPSVGGAGANLLTNGDFGTNALPPWTTFGTITAQAPSGVLQMIRPSGTPPAGVVLQPTGQGMTSGQILTATFDLGNSSGVRKRVTAIMHDLDFSDLVACVFWVPPNQLPTTYSMIGWASKNWTNATMSFYAATIGPDQWTLVDNVVYQTTPGATTTGSTCKDATFTSVVNGAAAAPGVAAAQGATRPATPAAATWIGEGFAQAAGGDGWEAVVPVGASSTVLFPDPIDLRDATRATLHLQSWLSAPTSRAAVQVRSAAGGQWVTAAEVLPSDTWEMLAIDLSPFAGELLDVQLVCAGEAAAEIVDPGTWRVDEVRVEIEP